METKICPACKTIGCWTIDEEDKEWIVCRCGYSIEYRDLGILERFK